ncbi:hypothetical protein NKH63_25830 [Mesorhizobium sp. M0960]|uniref:hypothetical protein n=1 Tax=Mesorhizobium sp. M0960 TaxID=2957035 RepID=UPI00333B008B
MLQFVGIGAPIEPHIFRLPKGVRPTYLLTSDGAHSIGKKALDGIAKRSRNPAELVRKIIYVAEAIGVEDNSTAVSVTGSDVIWAPPFGDGIELTLWGLGDKLVMWLEGHQSRQPVVPKTPKDSKFAVTAEKPKRPPRVRPKAGKKADSSVAKKNDGDVGVKPQLNIEFGSQDSEES